ncbi:MAG: DUF1573 domain-containing protein [Planctomycetota bacterium]
MGDVDVAEPTAVADEPDTPRPTTHEGTQPTADFAETKHNFGTMLHMSRGAHKFKVTNNGDAVLKLKAGHTTCQCTLGEVGTQELAPGESTTIELSWQIKNPAEHFEHSAVIHTNAPEHKDGEVRLIVQGQVAFELMTMPPDELGMGTVEYGEPVEKEFILVSKYHDAFEILSIDCPRDFLDISYSELSKDELVDALRMYEQTETLSPADPDQQEFQPVPARHGYRVKVTTNDKLPVGSMEVPLTIVTNLEGTPQYAYTVTVRRSPPFEFFPVGKTRFIAAKTQVSRPAFDAADGGTMELLMLATGMTAPLEVSAEETDPDWLEVNIVADKTASGVQRQRLQISIPPGTPSVMRTSDDPATVKLRTNHPQAEHLTLNVIFLSN